MLVTRSEACSIWRPSAGCKRLPAICIACRGIYSLTMLERGCMVDSLTLCYWVGLKELLV